MFCKNCGKVIDGQSVFCTWCGTRNGVPEEEQQPVSGAAEDTTVVSEGTPDITAQPKEEAAQEPVYEQAAPEKPEQSASEPMGEQTGTSWGAEVPLSGNAQALSEKPDKPVKYYTGGHITLCLVTAGIMAAAAGVFAALYFSVIL